ncbi:MAG: PTS sugar transporter subunit IIA, partial [Holdemanella sp.]|nr:PTS sugar transporter subunit IIA [Holdemanella sp.]
MIEKLIKKENIILGVESVKDWKEAIHLSLEPLVKGGYCTDGYEEAVIKMTEQYGPYYVLCEEFALIHSNAFETVNETQMAVTTLKNPIKFSDDGYDVRILVALVLH